MGYTMPAISTTRGKEKRYKGARAKTRKSIPKTEEVNMFEVMSVPGYLNLNII
jgi:hypothetical protein